MTVTGTVLGLPADSVEAVATVVAVLVALGAAWFAWRQVSFAKDQAQEARTLRQDQTRPYVVVDIEPNREHPKYVDMTIKNYGLTLAQNVRIVFDPPLKSFHLRAAGVEAWSLLRNGIPAIPPGKEFRGAIGPAQEVAKTAAESYKVTVICEDAHGKEVPALTYILDSNMYAGMLYM